MLDKLAHSGASEAAKRRPCSCHCPSPPSSRTLGTLAAVLVQFMDSKIALLACLYAQKLATVSPRLHQPIVSYSDEHSRRQKRINTIPFFSDVDMEYSTSGFCFLSSSRSKCLSSCYREILMILGLVCMLFIRSPTNIVCFA